MSIPRLSARDIMPDALRGAVVALGNFDGFHLGHQAVAGEAIRQAKAAGKPAIIATFDPHPVRFFAPHVPWFRLTTLEQRQRLFAEAGADAMLVFDFDAELAATTAEELQRRGFVIGTIDNDPLGKTVSGVAEIRHGPSGESAAKLMAFYLPGAVLVDDGRSDATIDTALGAAFTQVAPQSEVESAILEPSPSLSGPGCPSPSAPAAPASPSEETALSPSPEASSS